MRKQRISKPFKELKKSILIYCDGDTEKNYIISLKEDRYKHCPIKIEPKLQNKGFSNVFKFLREMKRTGDAEFYHCILYVLDMDTIYQDRRLAAYKAERDRLQSAFEDGFLSCIESRPCIEFWFVLHFRHSDKLFSNYDETRRVLQNDLPDYEKTNKYSQTVYYKLKGKLSNAINRAKEIETRHNAIDLSEDYSYTHMHILIEVLDKLFE
ncbi:MAG: RloB family protein [Candidatus Cloacimonadaceae bacterium]|nr:RloB family protein [Candidatus Cloacimonadaceae bacterium]